MSSFFFGENGGKRFEKEEEEEDLAKGEEGFLGADGWNRGRG